MASCMFEVKTIVQGAYGFQVKIEEVTTSINDVFGERKTYPRKFYTWVSQVGSGIVVGSRINVDPETYDMVKEEFTIPETGEVIELTYLKVKR